MKYTEKIIFRCGGGGGNVHGINDVQAVVSLYSIIYTGDFPIDALYFLSE